MQTKYKTAFAALAGAGLGVAAMQGLNAQQSKALPAYVISNIDITDPALYKKYAQAVPATLVPYHAHYLVRGGKTVVLDGAPPKRAMVIVFDNLDDAERWRASSVPKDQADPTAIVQIHRTFRRRGPSSSIAFLRTCVRMHARG